MESPNKRKREFSPDITEGYLLAKRSRDRKSESDSDFDLTTEEEQVFVPSENFKVEIKNLPKSITFPILRRLILEKKKLKAKKIKLTNITNSKTKNKPIIAILTFENNENRDIACDALNGFEYRGSVLQAKVLPGIFSLPPLAKKAKGGYNPEKFSKFVVDSVAPLQKVPYNIQLVQKKSLLNKVLSNIVKTIININPDLKPTKVKGKMVKKLSLEVDFVLPSPKINGYRNKCEFTFGFDAASDKRIGFQGSGFRKGYVSVGSISGVMTVPNEMKKVVNMFEDYTSYSCFDPCDMELGNGLFQTLTIRMTTHGVMLYLIIRPSKNPNQSNLKTIKEQFDALFRMNNEDITSFYLKEAESQGQKTKNKPVLVFGAERITEEILGLKFEISPEAFFQVNSSCAALLYSKIAELAELDENTTLLDICCGTGTIGLACCKLTNVGQVIGIESCAAAVEDAERNAAINNFSDRCKFYNGTAENLVEAAMNAVTLENVVAVVNPPRAGLTSSVVATLRNSRRIKRIIFVACKLEASKENLISFARPCSKKYQGDYFIPEQIVALDMFPHTPGVESVIVLKRVSESDPK